MRLPFTSTTMLIAGGIFLLVLFVIVATMGRKSISGAPGGRSVDDRLSQFAGRNERNQPAEVKPLAKIDAAVSKGKQGSKIARDLARAALKLTVTEFILIKLGAAVAGAVAGAFVGRASPASMVLSAIVGGVLLSFAPNLYVGYAARKRVTSFNNQLGDGITLMANSLRSGYSFLQSMDLVS